MKLSESLVSGIREGKIVLFLGAGASRDARSDKGTNPPTGQQLGNLIADKFLGGTYRNCPLSMIADYAISEADLGRVQSYIRELFEDFIPSAAHRKIPSFRWHGLATTNYDRLIEKAYEDSGHLALQDPRPLIADTDKVEENQRDSRYVLLLKLHGCVSRIADKNCKLILTPEQYIEHRNSRERLFSTLRDWSYEHPIVFVGHSLQDPDIRSVLLELASLQDFRPRNYIIAPDIDDVTVRYWAAKKVDAIKGTFSEFMNALDAEIAPHFRTLSPITSTEAYPISRKFRVYNASLSRASKQFLDVDVDYVRELRATADVDATNFYKGANEGFSGIERQLDAHRVLEDELLTDYFLRSPDEPEESHEFVLIRAHAGAGKTILLRRLAWDAAKEYDAICLYLRDTGLINVAALQEIIDLCKERVYLFIDDAAGREKELRYLFKHIGNEGRYLTVIGAERINEWNMLGESANALITEQHELKYLSPAEIDNLLGLLERHKALGTLERLGVKERREAFAERAGRQLLVALHEATLGYDFEQILLDEFKHIEPFEAREVYLTVCVLNRLGVPVRAGIIARIHNIPFEKFRDQLFRPLEHVVFAEFDSLLRDYTYKARHPHIADIVFRDVLENPEERYDRYLRVLRSLNFNYSVDKQAFWQMVKAKAVLDLFPSHDLARALYDTVKGMVGDDAHYFHQRGLYEMNRPNGSLEQALGLLNRASELSPNDPTVKHSLAELKLRSVDSSRTELEATKLLREATEISMSLISAEPSDSFAHHALIKTGLKRLKRAIAENASDDEMSRHVKDCEMNLYDGLQRFPGDPFLLEIESELAQVLSDSERTMRSLKKAFDANPRNSFIAARLASVYRKKGSNDEAKKVLEQALDANRSDRKLHYAYAHLLMTMGEEKGDILEYHFRRAYTEGDENYEAQLLYARQLFINGKPDDAKTVFSRLSRARTPFAYRTKLMHPLPDTFEGKVITREGTYFFIARDGYGDHIYGNNRQLKNGDWKNLIVGSRVSFRIAFTLRGANAFDVRLRDSVPGETPDQMRLFRQTSQN